MPFDARRRTGKTCSERADQLLQTLPPFTQRELGQVSPAVAAHAPRATRQPWPVPPSDTARIWPGSSATEPPASRSITAFPAGVTRRMVPKPALVSTRAPARTSGGPASARWSARPQLGGPADLGESPAAIQHLDERMLQAQILRDRALAGPCAGGAEVQREGHDLVPGAPLREGDADENDAHDAEGGLGQAASGLAYPAHEELMPLGHVGSGDAQVAPGGTRLQRGRRGRDDERGIGQGYAEPCGEHRTTSRSTSDFRSYSSHRSASSHITAVLAHRRPHARCTARHGVASAELPRMGCGGSMT